MDAFSEILNLIDNKSMDRILRVLKLMSTICSFFYGVADNIVWLAGLGFMSPKIFKSKWKNIKNNFSLAKTILELIISVYNISLKTI